MSFKVAFYEETRTFVQNGAIRHYLGTIWTLLDTIWALLDTIETLLFP